MFSAAFLIRSFYFVFPCGRPQRGFSPLHAFRGQFQTLLGLPKNSCATPAPCVHNRLCAPGLWSTTRRPRPCRLAGSRHGPSPCPPSEPLSHLSVCIAQGGPKPGEMTPFCPLGTLTGTSFLDEKNAERWKPTLLLRGTALRFRSKATSL